jgi:3-hydroxyacyl-CoA dehydrogenase
MSLPEIIAVMGAGQMGSGIAQVAAASRRTVCFNDVNKGFCDYGK